MRAGASSRTAYGIGMRGTAIAAVVDEITIARGSWRASAVMSARRAACISTKSFTG